jgi:hypothetical protein
VVNRSRKEEQTRSEEQSGQVLRSTSLVWTNPEITRQIWFFN